VKVTRFQEELSMGKQIKKVATGRKAQVEKPTRRSSRIVEVSQGAEKTRGKREDAEEEAWIAKLLAATSNSAPAPSTLSAPASVDDFKHLKKTAGYFEALAQARLLTDEQMPRLRVERWKAMQRTEQEGGICKRGWLLRAVRHLTGSGNHDRSLG